MADVKVSVIIPTARGHWQYLPRAVSSVYIQDVSHEVIVINDATERLIWDWELPKPIVLQGGGWGPGRARNEGAKIAKGEAFVFLDADDMLVPGALAVMWRAYSQSGKIIYGDVIRSDDYTIHYQPEPYYGDDLEKTCLHNPKRMPTCLIPKEVHEGVGGWDEDLPLWEDIDYEISTSVYGACEEKVSYPIYFYRFSSSTRRVKEPELAEQAKEKIKEKWQEYYEGEAIMGCSSCGSNNPRPNYTPSGTSRSAPQEDVNALLQQGYTLELEFTYPQREKRTYIGQATGNRYRFAQSRPRLRRRQIGTQEGQVHPDDAQGMLSLRKDRHNMFKLNKTAPPRREAQVDDVKVESKPMPKPKPKPSKELPKDEADAIRAQIEAEMASKGGRQLKSIKSFTVKEMREESSQNDIPSHILKQWIAEEEASDSPRKTMISTLEGALGSD